VGTEDTAGARDDFPRAWRFDQDGATVEGTFVGWSKGHTEQGAKTILLLQVGGETRGVWLLWTVLAAKLAREVAVRPGGDFEPGERITITRLGKVEQKSDTGRRPYVNFAVSFPDAKPLTAAQALGETLVDVEEGRLDVIDEQSVDVDANGDVKPGQDDDIPF
jgi:hypothetical protein